MQYINRNIIIAVVGFFLLGVGYSWATGTLSGPAGGVSLGAVTNAGTFAVQESAAVGVEDAAETAGATLMRAGSVRRDVPASSANATGDNATMNTNALGATWVAHIDPCSSLPKLFVPISQTTGTQIIVGTASKRTYVCAIHVISTTAQNIALVSGTGTVCATSTGGMAGGTTAATGWNFSANAGLVLGNGGWTVAKSDTDAENICILMSGTGQLSGTLSYVVEVN